MLKLLQRHLHMALNWKRIDLD